MLYTYSLYQRHKIRLSNKDKTMQQRIAEIITKLSIHPDKQLLDSGIIQEPFPVHPEHWRHPRAMIIREYPDVTYHNNKPIYGEPTERYISHPEYEQMRNTFYNNTNNLEDDDDTEFREQNNIEFKEIPWIHHQHPLNFMYNNLLQKHNEAINQWRKVRNTYLKTFKSPIPMHPESARFEELAAADWYNKHFKK
jgi:hypothetical protein